MKPPKRTVITDLQNPMQDVRDAIVMICGQMAKIRIAAAHLRTADQINNLLTENPQLQIGDAQVAIDEFSESIGHAVARMTEVRAHVAVANNAMAKISKLLPQPEPKGPLS